MTVSVEQLRQRLLPQYPDLEDVGENVVRFIRRAGSRPFAVYYVDVSAHIPNTAEELNEYQDRIIGRRFFEGSKSLQWSNYLYFVVGSHVSLKAKEIVECDRKYARKYVVTESELTSALTPPVFQVAEGAIDSNILSTWTNLLAAANLDRAVLNDEPLPRRLELIEAAFGQGAVPTPAASSVRPRVRPPFLRQIELRTFRAFPVKRTIVFGTVTLICGANGTGKTSLLEAIELVYCGRNKRNPSANEAYAIAASFADGKAENASHRQPPATFRDRNLAWYGQLDVRTNTLYQSFSRFNFLNTDAAVGLAEAKDDFEDDLSKLLVGPDTSKTWREIERTSEKLADKIKELEAVRNQVDLEMASVDRQLSASGGVQQESNAVFTRLKEVVERRLWHMPDGDPEASARQLVETLAGFDALVSQGVSFEWVGAPVTIDKLRRFVEDGGVRCSTAENEFAKLRTDLAEERRQKQLLSHLEQNVSDADELSRCIASGIPERLGKIETIEKALSQNRMFLAGYVEERVREHTQDRTGQSVREFVENATVSLSNADKEHNEARTQYARFAEMRDETINLAQRLRDLAGQILATSVNPDVCPLCHTPFPVGELATHIQTGTDLGLEAEAGRLMAAVRQKETLVNQARAMEEVAAWMKAVCVRIKQPESVFVGKLIEMMSDVQIETAQREQTLTQLRDELSALEAGGLTSERYSLLSAKVLETKGQSDADIRTALGSALTQLNSDKNAVVLQLQALRTRIRETEQTAGAALGITAPNIELLESTLAMLRERLAAVKGVLERINPYFDRCPWPAGNALSDLLVEISSIRKLASDFQATLANERKSVTVLAEATKRKEQLQKQLAGLVPRIDRFKEAENVLTNIRSEHSLAGGMEEALRQNRSAIEAIFERIHSPAEFSGLGNSLTTLIRKNGGTNATLQQISTGQRAAFALSLFLAQNAQLRSAPPLVLIDDPIAHVDDLNCLSFLDYLREIVVTGDRQIVFATANEKLAMLFQRKFEFLGEPEVRRHDLLR